ncbi:hypothetical protein QOZ83_05950 [Romboutsia sedimentorum]|uniref:hypothetical protein n=1 Tax=Romboutsia sedimentorum TaxID=1368474 RepID=UPI0024DE8298|nr:hypothetical protein [Romboutsia sedimentorum]MDK2585401.1 hypothetical protein [Romboutsia sedimentorum]
MNCKGYLEINFASYLVIDNTMNFKNTPLKDIPLAIAVNTENLHAFIKEEEYTPVDPIPVPNPCYPSDPTKDILVDTVTLNELRVSGLINYIVGADILETSSNVVVNLPATKLEYSTVSGDAIALDEVLLFLENPNVPVPQLLVTVTDLKVTDQGGNIEEDHWFEIRGTFRIDAVI